jgi:hypothetical protein
MINPKRKRYLQARIWILAVSALIGAIIFGVIGSRFGIDANTIDVITGVAGALIFMKIFALSRKLNEK